MQLLPNGQIQLQWPQGTLMKATNLVNGTWSAVPNAGSPYTTLPAGPGMFYRVNLKP
jgi:hypothetical protein